MGLRIRRLDSEPFIFYEYVVSFLSKFSQALFLQVLKAERKTALTSLIEIMWTARVFCSFSKEKKPKSVSEYLDQNDVIYLSKCSS